MIILYHIELYDNVIKKYKRIWSGPDIDRANIQMSKSYNRTSTRRLIKETNEVLCTERAQRRLV